MSRPTTQAPTITIGARLTDFGTLDLTVEGLSTAGGMGLVVWGKNAAAGNQMMALKLLKPERLAAARSSQQRRTIERQFEDEALVWCHVWDHPCVVTAFGLTRLHALGDLPVLELDYAPNGSLRDYLRLARVQRSHPPLRAALAWAIHIASALAHIHQPDPDHDRPAPLVHCDLKPENVLLDEHGWAQLTDLGLTRAYAALAAEPEETLTSATTASPAGPGPTPHEAEVARLRAILQAAGAMPSAATAGSAPPSAAAPAATVLATRTLRIPPAPSTQAIPVGGLGAGDSVGNTPARAAIGSRGPVAGTPQYMAPEQWEGINATLPATDLYAFGVLLYELFAGSEAPYPFPHDPNLYLTLELQDHALQIGYNPVLLAWHAAHTAPAGPTHRLTDPDVAQAALRSGPLAELVAQADVAGRGVAYEALQQLDTIAMACLSPDPAARPSAATVLRQLEVLALEPCGLDPISSPSPASANPQDESRFWGNLGKTYSDLDREEEAFAVRRRAIEHDPTDARNWLNLGASLAKRGIGERRKAVEVATNDQPAEIVATYTEAARQLFEEALAAFQQAELHLTPQAIATSPTVPAMVTNNQAAVLDNLGRTGDAVTAYQRALVLQPDMLSMRFNLALTYARWSQEQAPDATLTERLARLRAAQTEIQIVLDAAPTFTQARALAAEIARALADPEHRFVG